MSDTLKSKSAFRDLQVLWHLLARPVRGNTHAERLEHFYQGQAEHYDAFRADMLHGRAELISSLDFPPGGVWVDLGAGTGENICHAKEKANALSEIHLVDLSPSLLARARTMIEDRGLTNVQTRLTDATTVEMPRDSVDVVTLSYSLTMIPDWFEAIRVAESMLKPGGTIAVVDFYVSRKYARSEERQHGWLRRAFWSHWFATDNVFLSGDHLGMLKRRFETVRVEEHFGKVPYLPLLRAPYYLFVGRKRSESRAEPSNGS